LLTFNDVLEALTGSPTDLSGISRMVIPEATVDSRQVIPGALFVALPGERTDGHLFVKQAFKNGASVALVQEDMSAEFQTLDLSNGGSLADWAIPGAVRAGQPLCLRVSDTLASLQQIARFWRRKLDLRVIGVTGSVGKSTTKELIYEVLSHRYRTLKNLGNQNNEIGLPLSILRLGYGYQRAVLEMGFYVPGEISLLCDIAAPQVGVITNIGTVHAERAGSREAIAKGKSELVQALPAGPTGTAILNYDDPFVRAMAQKTSAQVLFYGLDPAAHLWADVIESHGLEGIAFRLHFRGETLHIRVPLIGRHSVHTALRAAAVGLTEGMTWAEIIHALHTGQTQLRLVAVRTEIGALLIDDSYNAAPESTLAALNLLAEMSGRKIAVLGDMLELGQYENEGHELVGSRAAEVVDHLICVGEISAITALSARKAGLSSARIERAADALAAIDILKPMLKEGDVVLVKGSHGLRMDRIISALEVGE
jgi:UDP-N-acetylmuramoyl-tripeptide--D-alanyl-D-alanine ligase